MWCAIYLACLLFVGFAVAASLASDRPWIERLAVAACAGPAVVGFALIFFSMIGVPPSRAVICGLAVYFAPLGFLHVRRIMEPRADSAPTRCNTFCIAICCLAIGYSIAVISLDVFTAPTITWDAFAIWQLKAKVLAIHALHPRPDYFTDVSLSFSHLRYPILVPMLSAGVHAMSHTLHSGLEKSPAILLTIGLGAAVYSAIRMHRGILPAAACTALVLTLPAMLNYAGSGTADLPLAAFYAASLLSLFRWQAERQNRDLLLFAIFTAALPWTKNEGIAMAAANLLVLFFLTPRPRTGRYLRREIFAAILVLAIYLPWMLYTHRLPRTDENYAQLLTPANLAAGIGRLPGILAALFGEMVALYNWGIFWLLLPAAALIKFRRTFTRPAATLWILLILQFLSLLPPFMVVANWNLAELLRVTQDRLLLHLAPAAAILIGLYWPFEEAVSDAAS
jgi:4-amino-4-deoxy-L-arabinose transferase-like glycosyltransferase